jgi:hypothetical protein
MTVNRAPLRKPAPVGSLVALLLSCLCAFGFLKIWLHQAPALQAFYLPVYAKNTLLPSLSLSNFAHKPTRYFVVYAGCTLAIDETLPVDARRLSVRASTERRKVHSSCVLEILWRRARAR